MLVLSRKNNQEILLNDNITIRVIQTGNNRVKLGVIADKDIAINRGDVAVKSSGGIMQGECLVAASPKNAPK